MKYLLDTLFSFFLLILFFPILFTLSLIWLFKYRENPIFIQQRIGYNNKLFILYKLKSMTSEKDNYDTYLSDSVRLTKFGSFLRKFSIDELPQLFNILKGDMSFVGPRPLLVEYLPLYSLDQRRRHEVKPGITGWAQVNGRNSISWEKKFELDVWYVDNRNFFLDLKILFMTVLKVFKRDGISSDTSITMEKFKGSNL